MPFDPRDVAAAAAAVLALVCDAATAVENGSPVPQSLRSTGFVLAVLAAAPTVAGNSMQRTALICLLASAANAGDHAGGWEARAADAAFCLVVGASALWLVSSGGIDAMAKRREGGCPLRNLAAALCFFASVRALRAGALLELVALDFRDAGGEAFASSVASSFCAAGAAAAAAAAAGVLLGVDAAADAAAAAFAFAAGGLIAFQDQVEQLSVLFGPAACKECDAALRGRRFALTAAPCAALFAVSLSLLFLARRPPSALAGAAGLAPLAAAAAYFTFDGVSSHSDYASVACFAGAWLCLAWPAGGALLFFCGLLAEEVGALALYGPAVFAELTHCVLALSLLMLVVHLFVRGWRLAYDLAPVRAFLGASQTAGESVGAGLFVGSVALLACMNGNFDLLRDSKNGGRWGSTFVVQHFLLFPVWLSLRSQKAGLAWWLAPLGVVFVAYAAVLAAVASAAPGLARVDGASAAAAGAAALFAWAAGGAAR